MSLSWWFSSASEQGPANKGSGSSLFAPQPLSTCIQYVLRELLNCTEAHRTELNGVLVQPPLGGWKAELFSPCRPHFPSRRVSLRPSPKPTPRSGQLDFPQRPRPGHWAGGLPVQRSRTAQRLEPSGVTTRSKQLKRAKEAWAPALGCRSAGAAKQAPSSCVAEALQQSAVFPAVLPQNSFHLQTRDVH